MNTSNQFEIYRLEIPGSANLFQNGLIIINADSLYMKEYSTHLPKA